MARTMKAKKLKMEQGYLAEADLFEKRLPGESPEEFFRRLEQMGYRVAGLRMTGEVMVAPPFPKEKMQ